MAVVLPFPTNPVRQSSPLADHYRRIAEREPTYAARYRELATDELAGAREAKSRGGDWAPLSVHHGVRRARMYWRMMLAAIRRGRKAEIRLLEVQTVEPAVSSLGANDVSHVSIPAALHHRSVIESAELVAAVAFALEDKPWSEPCILLVRRLEATVIAVAIPDFHAELTPDQARLVALTLTEDQAFTGCMGVAARLNELADQAQARTAQGGPIQPSRSGRLTLIAAAAGAAILGVIDALSRLS